MQRHALCRLCKLTNAQLRFCMFFGVHSRTFLAPNSDCMPTICACWIEQLTYEGVTLQAPFLAPIQPPQVVNLPD